MFYLDIQSGSLIKRQLHYIKSIWRDYEVKDTINL